MMIKAQAKYIRISPKKVRELGRTLKGLKVAVALNKLTFLKDKASEMMVRVIKSAVSNAKNNLKIGEQTLKISSVSVTKGPFLKRFQPVSRGMAHSIKKRTAHLLVILEVVEEEKKVQKDNTGKKKNQDVTKVTEKTVKEEKKA